MLPRALVATLALLIASGPALAQLDPEPKTPILWRVVLKAQPHPLLSASFREQLKRDLLAALQPTLGPLGTVEVIDLAEVPRDKWVDPLWQQFDDKGFEALAATRDLTGAKTHFFKVGYKDGLYLLESRQHDGFAGLASPVVRRQSLRAPELVGRTAGLMLDRDFGIAGTIEGNVDKGNEVKVVLRAGHLGSVARLVKVGDVFAVSQVMKTDRAAPPPLRTATGKLIAPPAGSVPPPGLSARPRTQTLLRVNEVGKDGVLRCGMLTSWKTPLPGNISNLAGYRCMKLGTVEAPLAVRLVSGDGSLQKTAGQVTVRATEAGFNAPLEARDTFDYREGIYRSGRPLSNVACVVVALGGGEGKQYPVPILGSEPVSLQFETNPKAAAAAEFNRMAQSTFARVADARNAQTICFEATGKLIDKHKNADALARAKGGFQSADAEDKGISDDIIRLKDQEAASPDGGRLIAAIEQQLVVLRKSNGDLGAHIKKLEEIVRRENDPTIAARQVQAEALAESIAVLLSRGDVDEALVAYDQFATLLEGEEAKEARAARDKLKADWKPKSETHAKAREYLLKTWPAVATVPDFKESMPKVGAAVEVCIENGDRLALRKLLTVINAARVKLNDLLSPLDASTDADSKLIKDINKTNNDITALESKIVDFVKKK